MHPLICCLLTAIYTHDAVSVLNINGFKVDRSNLKRIFAAHILKDERSVKTNRTVMERDNIDPLVDTLLAHFGQSKLGCCAAKPKNKTTAPKQAQVVPFDDEPGKWQKSTGPPTKVEIT